MSEESDLEINIKAGFNFDPEWDVEQAMAAGHDGPLSPFHRWAAWIQLGEYKKRYKAGNKECLFSALHQCACSNLPMPDWLAEAYRNGFHEWVSYRAPSLDQAFNVKIPKGQHVNKLRELRRLNFVVPRLVKELHAKGQPIDQQLFADVGKELGIGGSKARDIYYKYNPLRHLQKKA